jgi:hypothetical protein
MLIMALFRKGILSALADSISMTAQVSAAQQKQDLLLNTAENMQLIGEIVNNENFSNGIKASTELVEVVKQINKML